MSTADPLSASALATTIVASLPKGCEIKNAWEATALAVHAGMLNVGFKLKGLGEDHRIEASSDAQNIEPLPSEWKAQNLYTFRYSHPQSSMEYFVKISRLGSKAIVDGIADGDDKRASFDIPVKDYVSEGNLPATPVPEDTSPSVEAERKITDIFISAGRLQDLGKLLKLQIIQKLAPGISKDGYEEESTSATTSGTGRRDPDETGEPNLRDPQRPAYDPLRDPLRHDPPARPHPFADPDNLEPRRPFPPGLEPPGFEDEYEIGRGPRRPLGDRRNPLNIGHDDLYPPGLGPNDPMYGSGIPPLRGGGGGGGMHPTFDDPLFGGRGPGSGGVRGDPQVPGGARYDPVFPGDSRGGPGGFPGAGHRGPGGGPPNPFGGFGSGDFI